MNLNRYYFTLIVTLVVVSAYSQLMVKGIIRDENGNPIPFASASLIAAGDSLLIKGSLTDDHGVYKIENVSPGQYRLLASFLGYTSITSDIFELKASNQFATVDINFINKGIVLDETVITAKRPFLEQKSDRLVVNVASSAVAAGGTAMEILQKVPGVVVTQDRVTLGGSQNLQIWIDGKPSLYTDMNAVLRDMPW
ncbi:MAG: carboxypeptidase regulatory-like domain-containing protein [Saprospiraceae bacterium]|nr:carboxypeptidase regulatory-like domain-containing protein [Saprospiraceae bacterium]